MEPKKSNAITVIKHFGLITNYLLTREFWIDCLSSRMRIALLKFCRIFYSIYVLERLGDFICLESVTF